jgi:CBS domain-containing protein
MNRELVVVPRQMLMREAVRLVHRVRAGAAAVVDEQGRCVGMLSPADVYRWVEAGCPETAIDPALTCPYQVRGRLLTGGEAVICTLAHGSCPFQAEQAASAGRHTDVCLRRADQDPPFGTPPRYLTTDVVTVRCHSPLPELVRRIVDAHADRLFVLDELDRPVGTVSAADVLGHARS